MTVGVHPADRNLSLATTHGSRVYGPQPGRDRTALEPPPQRADHLAQPLGQREPETITGERAHSFAGDPAVRGDVVDAVETSLDRERDGRRHVVEVHELGDRVVLAEAMTEAGGESAHERRRTVLGHGQGRPQDRDRTTVGAAPPLLDELLGRRQLAGEHELGVGAQHRFLGDRDRVVRERAVHHRRRHHHEVRSRRRLGVGEEQPDRLGDALAPAGSSVVVADAQLDDRVEMSRGGALRLAGRDVRDRPPRRARTGRGSPSCCRRHAHTRVGARRCSAARGSPSAVTLAAR